MLCLLEAALPLIELTALSRCSDAVHFLGFVVKGKVQVNVGTRSNFSPDLVPLRGVLGSAGAIGTSATGAHRCAAVLFAELAIPGVVRNRVKAGAEGVTSIVAAVADQEHAFAGVVIAHDARMSRTLLEEPVVLDGEHGSVDLSRLDLVLNNIRVDDWSIEPSA